MSSVARFDTWQAADGTNVARFNAGALEVWDGSAWSAPSSVVEVEYLVIAGGGGGGGGEGNDFDITGGGGGAGGYRNSYASETSGGTATTETPVTVPKNVPFSVIVGAGGAGAPAADTMGSRGNESVFYTVTSIGGGRGPGNDVMGQTGGSGSGVGGDEVDTLVGDGIPGQGSDGGQGSSRRGGGGGGAGGAGSGTSGGVGLASSITGSSVTRAAGGSGFGTSAGGANTGEGGDSQVGSGSNAGQAGGSGVVIFRVPSGTDVTFSAGVTQSSATDGSDDVYTVTATSTTDETVTFA